MSAFVSGTANATDTSNTSVIAAQGAGVRTYLYNIGITNASATDTEVIIKDGTTEMARYSAPANGGAIIGLGNAPLVGTANTAWQFAAADSVTTIYVTISVARRMRQSPSLQMNPVFETERATVSAQLELQGCDEIRAAWATACTRDTAVEADNEMVKLMKSYVESI